MSLPKQSQLRADITIDVRGEICPMPMMRTCVALKRLKSRQILAVLTDYAPSVDSIREGVENLGCRFLTAEKQDKHTSKIFVEKII